ncbi:NADH dehydrogenase [ubiquinone] 1 beta subcomplex subunit 10-like [Homarus americanus]|uniref:NADH dehydrogenase [ubiquinone] 1 beta subcomplex subunit 10 n=1 Tax=Homarus americanus TaxID=6706 RepID=A0A8J5N2M3_HOMAM|nr:NADH dehydrogenase [ubiquinone] 1 beta subcomplex subunit 10-like [Homarus americanus]
MGGGGDDSHNTFISFIQAVSNTLDAPVTMVDNEVLNILRQRQEDCILYEATDHKEKCAGLMEVYDKAAENWFIKYGDLGVYGTVVDAYMKQKHRMIWERRHGPVGSGMKDSLA